MELIDPGPELSQFPSRRFPLPSEVTQHVLLRRGGLGHHRPALSNRGISDLLRIDLGLSHDRRGLVLRRRQISLGGLDRVSTLLIATGPELSRFCAGSLQHLFDVGLRARPDLGCCVLGGTQHLR